MSEPSEPFQWTGENAGMQMLNTEGRVTSIETNQAWMIMSMQWGFLKAKSRQEYDGVAQGRGRRRRAGKKGQ